MANAQINVKLITIGRGGQMATINGFIVEQTASTSGDALERDVVQRRYNR